MPSLTLTPRGHLLFTVTDDAVQPSAALSRRLERAFALGSGHGLLELGAAEVGTVLPADFGYWRDFAARLPRAERIRWRRQQAAPALVAPAGAARRRRVPVAEDDGRRGRDLWHCVTDGLLALAR